MTSLRRASLVTALGAAAAAGTYTLVYLARWEWHRALITALFFLAAEVGLAAAVILRRLARLERRLDDLAPAPARAPAEAPAPTEAPALTEAPAPAATGLRRRFDWLMDDGRCSVFLPVLVGAGVLASLLAWVVESVARMTARSGAGHRLHRRLAPLAWPPGGLSVEPVGVAPTRRRGVRPVVVGAAGAVALTALAGGIGTLADATQTRPDHRRPGASTAFELKLQGRRSAADSVRAGRDLWAACQHSLIRTLPVPEVVEVGPGRVVVTVAQEVGRSAQMRLRGCLADAAVDHLQAAVVAVRVIVPPGAAEPSGA